MKTMAANARNATSPNVHATWAGATAGKHLDAQDLEHERTSDHECGHAVEADALGKRLHAAASSVSSGRPPPIATPASAKRT